MAEHLIDRLKKMINDAALLNAVFYYHKNCSLLKQQMY
jgi:hypothetical protein